MNGLVETIQKIGIFMIAAQAVIHFAPGQKYEKYIKLIVGVMVLMQLLSPIYRLIEGADVDWEIPFADFTQQTDMERFQEELAETHTVENALVQNMEKEIRQRLEEAPSGEAYQIISVTVNLSQQNEANHNSSDAEQYRLDMVRVAVRGTQKLQSVAAVEKDSGSGDPKESESENPADVENMGNIGRVEKIQIQKIYLEEDAEIPQKDGGSQPQQSAAGGVPYAENGSQNAADSTQDAAERLRKEFCDILGMEEKYMEVVIYGAVQAETK